MPPALRCGSHSRRTARPGFLPLPRFRAQLKLKIKRRRGWIRSGAVNVNKNGEMCVRRFDSCETTPVPPAPPSPTG